MKHSALKALVTVLAYGALSFGSGTLADTPTPANTPEAKEDAEKQVTFYTSYGYEVGQHWHIPFKLWVSEHSDAPRRFTARGARQIIADKAGLAELTDAQIVRYQFVVEGFIADSESNESVAIVFDNDPLDITYVLKDGQGNTKTDRNGNLEGNLVISQQRADQLLSAQDSSLGWLTFKTMSREQSGEGRIRLIRAVGVSIISDIDDTIKDTGITLGHDVVLKNTFFETFGQVLCMAKLYSSLDNSVAFHYVSGAPWQLYTPIADFLFSTEQSYPLGSLHMKNVRTNLSERSSYSDIWKLISQGSQQTTFEQKIDQITQLIINFPVRQFILIGDSGERDPEVFAEIRKRFPAHIERIVIRDLDTDTEPAADNNRFNDMVLIKGDAGSASGCPASELLIP